MKRKHPLPIPEGFTPDSIRLETSTCTGERTIGFFDPADRKLHCAELVRREEDITAFYAKYGLSARNNPSFFPTGFIFPPRPAYP